ncbi:hypothetical protein [Pyxidicoccus xibeiensis]|uniref:hypothetical protein n=1 Tax=Pyxidicoccus xibeiensis TaxID=2906759 RepID=UPI0020A788B4|nr:hypothetical protein [Pyxidicoccus xibeiensis]MCP3139897.1 hypothetical protein [Pyxidicoccus xibeiensis]
MRSTSGASRGLTVGMAMFALVLGACGVDGMEGMDARGLEQGEAEPQALSEPAVCTRGAMPATGAMPTLSEWSDSNDNNRCDGAWVYRENESCVSLSECGCKTAASCTSWKNGMDPVLAVVTPSFTIPVEMRKVCESLGNCDFVEDWPKTQANCNAKVSPEVQRRKDLITTEQQAHGLSPAGQFLHLVTAVPNSLSLVDLGNGKATCSFKVNVPRAKHATSLAVCGCQAANSCQNDTCAAKPTPLYSAVGLSLNGLRSVVPAKVLHEGSFAPSCTTGEALSGNPALRYSTLKSSEQSVPATRTDALNAIRRTMMMMYEFHGGSLSDADRADARARYHTYNSLVPACGTTLATCNAFKSARPDVAASLQRCARLLSTHVKAVSLVAAELQECLEVLTLNVRPIEFPAHFNACQPATPTAPHYFDEVQELYGRLWEKQLNIPTPPQGIEANTVKAARLEKLSRQLWSLDSTEYNSVLLRASDPRLTSDQKEALNATRLTKLLERWNEQWDKRYALTAPFISALDGTDGNVLVTELSKGRTQAHKAAQELALGLFTPVSAVWRGTAITSVPTDGDVLNAMLGDALQPLATRLDELSTFHDFSCSLRDCRSESTPLSQTYRLLAGLKAAPNAEFAAALAGATTDLSGWRPVFAKLAEQGGLWDVAMWMALPEVTSASPNLDGVRPAARPLVQLILDAGQRYHQYQVEGVFVSSPTLLRTGQHEGLRDELVQLMSQQNQQLIQKRDRFSADIIAFARELIGQTSEAGNLERLRKQREQKTQEHEFLTADRNGLTASAAAEEVRFGTLTDALTRIEGSLSQNEFVDLADSQTFFVSGGDARYPGTGAPDLTQLGVGPTVQLPAGRFLSVLVDPASRWAPTCALRSASFLKPSGGNTPVAGASEALIGPEGYSLTFSDDTYQARSTTDSRVLSAGVSVRSEVCVGSGPIGEAGGVEAKACLEAHAGVEWSKGLGHSNEDSQRASAAFALGLRLKDTPFKEAPVGALLAVVIDNATNKVTDYQVVRAPATTVFAPGNSRVVFVVNDRTCATPNTVGRLKVTVNTVTTVGAVAPYVIIAMSEVLTAQRFQVGNYVNQGRLLSSESSLLRKEANQKLSEKLAPAGVTLGTLPEPLTTLFDSFLEKEIVSIERAVELQDLERKLVLIQLELQAMDFDIHAGEQGAKLHELIIDQMVRDMDGLYLREKSTELMRRTQEYLLPALRIWYPRHLAQKLGQPQDSVFKKALGELSNTMPVDQAVLDLVTPATTVVSELMLGFTDAPFGNVPDGQDGYFVRVSFPRPGLFEPNPLGTFFGSSSSTVDGVRAALFWDAVDDQGLAPVTITPEDIYASLSPQGMLPCNESTPVIRRIGFYFGSDSGAAYPQADHMNALGRLLSGYAPRQQSFLTEVGELQYQLEADSPFRTVGGSVFYGLTGAANTVLTSKVYDPSRPLGLSPFGTFHLDFTRVQLTVGKGGWNDPTYGTGLAQAKEFVVVMELDSKRNFTPAGVPVCQGLTQPPPGVTAP